MAEDIVVNFMMQNWSERAQQQPLTEQCSYVGLYCLPVSIAVQEAGVDLGHRHMPASQPAEQPCMDKK
jgi:hypothetical protein